MRRIILMGLLAIFSVTLFGCGETLNGIGKDVKRVTRGVKTVFIRDEAR